MKNLYLSLFVLGFTLFFSCKKEENSGTDATKSKTEYTGTNIPADYPLIKVDHKISVQDTFVKAGDTIVVKGVDLKYLTKTVLVDGKEIAIESYTDTTISIVVPDLSSGKMSVIIEKDTTEITFYYADLKCSYLKDMTITNFVVTNISGNDVSYKFDLTNNTGEYVDLKYHQGVQNSFTIQNYVAATEDGARSAAGGWTFGAIVGKILKPGEVVTINHHAVKVDNYLIVDIHGYIDANQCDVSIKHVEQLDLNF